MGEEVQTCRIMRQAVNLLPPSVHTRPDFTQHVLQPKEGRSQSKAKHREDLIHAQIMHHANLHRVIARICHAHKGSRQFIYKPTNQLP